MAILFNFLKSTGKAKPQLGQTKHHKSKDFLLHNNDNILIFLLTMALRERTCLLLNL